jgi:hypothetical protein
MGNGDNIKLSEKEDYFSPDGDSVVTTGGKSWWIYRLSLGGNSNYDLRGKDTSSENFILEETNLALKRIEKTLPKFILK